MSAVFIVEPATFQNFKQFIYVIGEDPANGINRVKESWLIVTLA